MPAFSRSRWPIAGQFVLCCGDGAASVRRRINVTAVKRLLHHESHACSTMPRSHSSYAPAPETSGNLPRRRRSSRPVAAHSCSRSNFAPLAACQFVGVKSISHVSQMNPAARLHRDGCRSLPSLFVCHFAAFAVSRSSSPSAIPQSAGLWESDTNRSEKPRHPNPTRRDN